MCGQVYRLITCGTVEEKIYRKQVFKGALSRSGTSAGVQMRYFSQQVSVLGARCSVLGTRVCRQPGQLCCMTELRGCSLSKAALPHPEAQVDACIVRKLCQGLLLSARRTPVHEPVTAAAGSQRPLQGG